MSQKINQILNENNIITIDDLKFKNNQKEILFLNNIKIIINNQININIINNDIKDIILNINPNKETIQKIKSINWNNLEKIISNKDKTKTNQRIYQDIIKLIKEELITEIKEETEKNRQIIEEKNKEKAKKFNLNIKFNYQETGKKTTTNDFILYFNQKLQHFAKYISPNLEDKEITRISNLEEIYNSNNQVTIIGLISNLKYTKNGHLIITLEDRSGQIECFLNKNKFNKETNKIIANLCLDEGIGITGKCGDRIIWIDEIITQKPLENKQLKQTNNTNLILTLSDLNIGSKEFNFNSFYKLLNLLNNNTKQEKLNKIAKNIKYIFITGNLVNNINDNNNSLFLSNKLKYKLVHKLLSQIPKDKCIIIIPGNQDSTSIYEPQPAINYKNAKQLYDMENSILTSNPTIITIENNFDIFLTSNTSHNYYKQKQESLKDTNIIETFKFLLEKRHLAPSHESTHYIPDTLNDGLKIKSMPDIFITGNTKQINIENCKGCTIITNGDWNNNNTKNNSKCILINTKTRKNNILNFG